MAKCSARFCMMLVVLAFVAGVVGWADAGEPSCGDVAGLWEGSLEFPGFALRVVFKLTLPADGTVQGTLARPDQGDDEIPITRAVLDANHVRLEVGAANAFFEGRIDRERCKLEGQWHQGHHTLPLVLKEVSQIRKPNRPQTPVPPFPYDAEDVVYATRDAPAESAGTLTLPRQGRPCPAVLLISGGGAQDRDVTILGHRFFLVLADYLTRRGLAVLRVDDRGVGASTGDRSRATSEDFAFDALAGVEFLKGRQEIDPKKIGLIGHSEGGIIASLAAARSSDVAFIVMMAGPGLSGEEYNLQFEASAGRALGLSEEAIAARRRFQERVFAAIKNKTDSVAEAELRRLLSALDPPLRGDQLEAAMKRFLSPWYRFSISHNPAETLQKVNCPVLALFGEKDVQVPPEGNAEALGSALTLAGNENSRVEVLPNLNHFFQTAKSGRPDEYGKIKETMSPTALKLIADWIREQTSQVAQDGSRTRRFVARRHRFMRVPP
ncbi:MAG: alpha/beta hydrolase [Phycisphaerales bacterium]|nr:MAG: alpha/beta hydrolase [Phycisphaerales bacterium]